MLYYNLIIKLSHVKLCTGFTAIILSPKGSYIDHQVESLKLWMILKAKERQQIPVILMGLHHKNDTQLAMLILIKHFRDLGEYILDIHWYKE